MSEVKIQRFMHHSLGSYFVNVKTNPFPSDYVEYSDYEKLKAQLERAEKVIQHYVDLFGDRYGGKEAREYFKEINKGESK